MKHLSKLLRKVKLFIKEKRVNFRKWKLYKSMTPGIKLKKLTKEQTKIIQQYYKEHTGKKINTRWHQYYYSLNDTFTPQYIPLELYHSKIIPELNHTSMSKAYADKNFSDILFPEILHPRNIIKNINGFFYRNGKPISREEAIKICSNLENVFIKYAIDTSWGMNVYKFSSQNGISTVEGKTINDLFNYYNKNFLVQESVIQHPILAKLNPTSVNTIRLTTYRREVEVVCVSAVVRIGGKDAVIDNVSAGGVYCGIDANSKLKKYSFAIKPSGKYIQSPTGVVLAGYEIPFYKKILEKAKEMHLKLPYCRIVGWDFSVNENEEIVLIELNANHTGVYQLVEPAFGNYTDEILNMIRSKKNA